MNAFRAAETAALAREAPLLLVSNHTAWWDPLFAIWLSNYILGVDGHAMMDAANLRRLPFFGKVGAFGVDLTDPADGARALRYAIKLLGRSPTSQAPAASPMVWIYAQGAERPITEPLLFRPGAAEIASLAKNAAVVPVGIRYEFARFEAPVACLSFGEPLARGAKGRVTTAALEAAVSGELARIDGALRDGTFFSDTATWGPLHSAAPSRLGMLAERLLAWLTAPVRVGPPSLAPPLPGNSLAVANGQAPVEVGPPSLAPPLPGNSLAVANGRAPVEVGPPSLATPPPANSLAVANGQAVKAPR